MSRKNKNKRLRVGMKRECRSAIDSLYRLREIAREKGIVLNVNQTSCQRGVVTYHFMFEDADSGTRLLDYWPGSGRTWCATTGEKSKVPDAFLALSLASAERHEMRNRVEREISR